ncbi:MAG: sodium/solute symporter [Pirellulales bacterium]|nr:sodium/solute symporter [Pirellulales bacterium]
MNAFYLTTADIVIIVLSLLAVLVVGFWASRFQDKTARGYFLASGRLPWWIIGSAFVSTSVSSEQIVGTVGAAYRSGMGIANWEWWSLPTYTLFIVILIPIYLRNRITTVSEIFVKRFGPLCGDIYSVAMLLSYVFIFLVPVLYSGSLTFSQLTGWNFYLILWTLTVLVGAYTIKGGLASVMWTDALQCIMLLGGGLVLYVVALAEIPGGWEAMVAAQPERFHLYHPPDDPDAPFLGLIFLSFGVGLFYQAANQVMVQRILGARSNWDGMMGIIFAGFINLARPLVTCFLGFIVWHWIYELRRAEPLSDPDTAFPFALKTFATSWGLRGVVLAGFLAAVMSTISALSNSTATLFSLDVYKKWINPQAEDWEVVRAGRLASFLSLAVAASLAPSVQQWGGVFKYFQTGVTYLATPFISVILMGVLWKRTNYAAALFGIIGGFLIQMLVALGAPQFGFHLHWLYLGAIAQALIMAGIAVVSFFSTPPPVGQAEAFQWSLAGLRHFQEENHRPWYQSLKLWFGIYASLWIWVYWRFW